jgi:hypothetical protein
MTKYEEYALLQKEIDVLDAKKELLRAEIEKDLPKEGFKSDILDAGWRVTKRYSYPENVKILEDNVKEAIKPIEEKFKEEIRPLTESVETAKKLSEENGTAILEEKKQLVIKVK